jgi:Zn-dependent protease with chaperone function
MMETEIIARLRHPKEEGYGIAMTILGVMYWVMILLVYFITLAVQPAEFGALTLYGVGFATFLYISAALFRAHIYGHYVMVSPAQFPHLHRLVEQGAARVGLSPTPTAFVYNSNGVINAFARRLFGGRFIFLTSAIIDADSDDQVNFVIGHELGHHAAGHLNLFKTILKGPAHFIPFLGPAYSRSRELTCDRIGAYLSNDMQASRTALTMLACGCRRLNSSLNCDAFEAQEAMVPGFWGWVSLIFARYPRTTQRVMGVSTFFAESVSQSYAVPGFRAEDVRPGGFAPWTPTKG